MRLFVRVLFVGVVLTKGVFLFVELAVVCAWPWARALFRRLGRVKLEPLGVDRLRKPVKVLFLAFWRGRKDVERGRGFEVDAVASV